MWNVNIQLKEVSVSSNTLHPDGSNLKYALHPPISCLASAHSQFSPLRLSTASFAD